MKIPTSITACSVALLSFALVNAPRADDAVGAKTEPAEQTQTTSDQAYSNMGSPAPYNKATGIIGLDIRNQNDKFLGRIRDVVFDLNSERVSYVVMGVKKGFLGVDEKLMAVPMSSLKASANGRYLILNADKAKLTAAAGFDKEHWPNVGNMSWGAQPFLEAPEQYAPGPGYDPANPVQQSAPPTGNNIAPGSRPDNTVGPTPTPVGVPPRSDQPSGPYERNQFPP